MINPRDLKATINEAGLRRNLGNYAEIRGKRDFIFEPPHGGTITEDIDGFYLKGAPRNICRLRHEHVISIQYTSGEKTSWKTYRIEFSSPK